jgi:hypothetical protein
VDTGSLKQRIPLIQEYMGIDDLPSRSTDLKPVAGGLPECMPVWLGQQPVNAAALSCNPIKA